MCKNNNSIVVTYRNIAASFTFEIIVQAVTLPSSDLDFKSHGTNYHRKMQCVACNNHTSKRWYLCVFFIWLKADIKKMCSPQEALLSCQLKGKEGHMKKNWY